MEGHDATWLLNALLLMHLFTRDLFMLTLSLFLIKNVTKKVVLSRVQRNKKKYVTVVTGLGTFGK